MDGWESQGTLYLIDAQPGIEPLLIGTGHSKRVGTVTNQFGVHELDKPCQHRLSGHGIIRMEIVSLPHHLGTPKILQTETLFGL